MEKAAQLVPTTNEENAGRSGGGSEQKRSSTFLNRLCEQIALDEKFTQKGTASEGEVEDKGL